MRLCFYANEGHVSKTMDSVYNTHLNFRSCFSGKKCVLYTGKYGNVNTALDLITILSALNTYK